MRIPTSEEVQAAVVRKVGMWLYGECIKIWGEGVTFTEKENMKEKLENAGYILDKEVIGMNVSYLLKKDAKTISTCKVNIFELTMEISKENTKKKK